MLITCLVMCLCWNMQIMLKKKLFAFSNLLSSVIICIELARVVYVSRFRNVMLFPVREHSKHWCSLVSAVHCGHFEGGNVPLHWKDFMIETALKWPTPWSVPWLPNKGADWDTPRNTIGITKQCFSNHRATSNNRLEHHSNCSESCGQFRIQYNGHILI